jgi:hypothetical protein
MYLGEQARLRIGGAVSSDLEQLDLIRHGAEPWNQWRGTNPLTIPDLSEADRRGEPQRGVPPCGVPP